MSEQEVTMSELPIQTAEQFRSELHKLFQDAGYGDHPLLRQMEAILTENDRLKLEIARLRRASGPRAGSNMSSKLREALRE
jgi:regulator of replication initiation timing